MLQYEQFLLIVMTSSLLLIILIISSMYYRRIRKVRDEYEKARNVIGDIIISFNRQFKKHENNFLAITHKINIISSENDEVSKNIEMFDKQVENMTSIIKDASIIKQKLSMNSKLLDEKIDDVKTAYDKMLQRIVDVEQMKLEGSETEAYEAKIEAAIPIKKEKALAPLTETELNVLEIISKEGKKTTSEIREEIKLTREHTARLMKKLYENGYLERETHKMPFSYHLKEEMQKILSKRGVRA